MKKLILSVTAIAGFSAGAFAQGVLNFDATEANTSASPTATTSGQTFINGVLNTSTDINAELLYSSTQAGVYSPVVVMLASSSATPSGTVLGVNNIAGGAGDISTFGDLYDNSGTAYFIPGVGAGATAYFEVEGWTGSSSTYPGTGVGTYGATAPFAEVLSSATGTEAYLGAMPALNLVTTTAVPEPSTLAMAGVGLASMLIFRRRNK